MLLKRVKSPKQQFAVAMMCLAAGIGMRAHGTSDFVEGIVAGIRIGLYGVAVILIYRARQQQRV